MVRITEESEAAQALLRFVRPDFEDAESEAIRRFAREYPRAVQGDRLHGGQPFAASERRASGLSIAAVFHSRTPIDGQALDYLEVQRDYVKPHDHPNAGCEGVSYFSGWLVERGARDRRLVTRDLTLTDCHYKNVERLVPLGWVRLGGRVFVFAQAHGYEHENDLIYEFNGYSLTTALEVPGGGC